MDKKDQITKEAFKLFLKNGFSHVSINDIIISLHMTKGGFYHYFDSKDSLIRAIFDNYVKKYFTGAIGMVKASALPPRQKLILLYETLAGFEEHIKDILDDGGVSFRKIHGLVAQSCCTLDYMGEFRRDFLNSLSDLTVSIINEAGEIPPGKAAEDAACKIMAVLEGLIVLRAFNENINVKKLACGYACEIFDSYAENAASLTKITAS